MKVIFLDVDGVLNCWTTQESYNGYCFVEDGKIQLLKQIVDCTGSVIVLSSDWRYYEDSFTALSEKLGEFNLTIYDKTPILNDQRYLEIDKWIQDVRSNEDTVDKFCILEDYWPMSYYEQYTVRTEEEFGLTQENVHLAIQLLGSEIND